VGDAGEEDFGVAESFWRREPVTSSMRALLTLLLAAAALVFSQPGRAQGAGPISGTVRDAATGPGNVVLVVADDHGQDLGAYGNTVIRTPNLDRLAADGALFRYAFATTASCSPSRSVILSGLHNHRTGQYGLEHAVHHFRGHEDVRGLPVLLAAAGFRTARVGKFHVAPEEAFHFEQVLSGDARNPVEMAENARAFLTERSERPFFFYFATSDPHRGGDPSVGQQAAGDEGASRLAPNRFGNRTGGYPGVETVTYRPEDVIVPSWLPDNAATRAELAEYYQSISRVDQGVGRLVHILKEAGVYDQTLILYISDHGAAFPGAKTTAYEPGLRSPLIVRHPGARKRGVRSNAMISWVDLAPTILDFAGVGPPTYGQPIENRWARTQVPERHGLHGRSFLSILEEENPAGWDEIYASHSLHEIQMYYPMRVVRGRKYKLIWNLAHGLPFPFAADLWASAAWQSVYRQGMEARYGRRTVREYQHRPEFELYDLESDPDETTNLARSERYAGVLAGLKEKIRAFQQRTSDPWLVKWEHQ
jgi:N-sulfoglucosamine sulfohydrolase